MILYQILALRSQVR